MPIAPPTYAGPNPIDYSYLSNASWNQQQGLNRLQGQTDEQRNQAMGNLYNAYNSPARQQTREADYSAQLGSSLADLQSQYQQGSRRSGLQMAAAGRLGSSGDLEAQGNLRYGYQSGAQDAANRAYQGMLGGQRADVGQYNSLQNALAAGSPQEAAQYTAQGQGLENQFNAQQGLLGFQQTQNALNRQQANNLSQGIGSFASGLGQQYQINQRAQYGGGNLGYSNGGYGGGNLGYSDGGY